MLVRFREVMKAKNATEVLIAAKWIIENVGWCQGMLVKQDYRLTPVAFCPMGAINYVETIDFKHNLEARSILDRAAGLVGIAYFNDQPYTTKEMILNLFDQAIKELKYKHEVKV